MSLRIFLHDFGGYPFITELGRELARRRHIVDHAFNARLTAGQDVKRRGDDADTFRFVPIRTRQHFEKYSIARRVPIEDEYGRLAAEAIKLSRPDVVLSANTPLFSQRRIHRGARVAGAAFVFWLQDLLGVGIAGELERRLGWVGRWPLGSNVERLERRLLQSSDHVIAISPRFNSALDSWGVPTDRRSTLPNWAPLEQSTDAATADVSWAREVGLPQQRIVLYAGTLGRKHDPTLLLDLATELDDTAQVVVVSEGPSVDQLAADAASRELGNLWTLPFQRFDSLPAMLASADIFLALLTADASAFSVPSKVMTYLTAARPIVASMPLDNPAAEIIRRHRAGIVSDVGDRDGFVKAVRKLIADPELAADMGTRGRAYAEERFDIRTIADRFEAILTDVVQN